MCTSPKTVSTSTLLSREKVLNGTVTSRPGTRRTASRNHVPSTHWSCYLRTSHRMALSWLFQDLINTSLDVRDSLRIATGSARFKDNTTGYQIEPSFASLVKNTISNTAQVTRERWCLLIPTSFTVIIVTYLTWTVTISFSCITLWAIARGSHTGDQSQGPST